MTENIWRTDITKQHVQHPYRDSEQIVCHSSLLTLPVLIMYLFMAASARGDFQTGVDAYEQGDYKTALQELRPLAAGDNPKAQFHLGRMYARGEGVPKDDAEAVKWYRKAAEQGDAQAQSYLGAMYYTGKGVPKDYAEAIKWFRKAAEQGDAKAQVVLGWMYCTGEGVAQNYVTAHAWYNLAGAQGNEEARKARDKITENITPAQLREAQRLAREWKQHIDNAK